jgi:mannitol/fructose-specific phosphotransferase system IIA component (Ntr-type)
VPTHHVGTLTSRTELKLSDVLSAGILVPRLVCADLDEALRVLLAPLLPGAGLAASAVPGVLEAVKQRERAGSTAIGPVALPHARVAGLGRIVAGLGANPGGVYGGAGEAFVLAFASPAQSPADHLRFLARAAHLFRDPDARQHILTAEDAGSMLAAIRRAED